MYNNRNELNHQRVVKTTITKQRVSCYFKNNRNLFAVIKNVSSSAKNDYIELSFERSLLFKREKLIENKIKIIYGFVINYVIQSDFVFRCLAPGLTRIDTKSSFIILVIFTSILVIFDTVFNNSQISINFSVPFMSSFVISSSKLDSNFVRNCRKITKFHIKVKRKLQNSKTYGLK